MEQPRYTRSDVLQDLRRSLEVNEASFGAQSQEVANLLRVLLFFATQSGDWKLAIDYALQLRNAYAKISGIKSADYLKLSSRIARIYSHQSQWELAAEEYAGLIVLKSESEDTAGELQATLLLGHCFIQTGQFEQAARLLEEYIRRKGPRVVQAHTYLAQALEHFDRDGADRILARQQDLIEDNGPDPGELFDDEPEVLVVGALLDTPRLCHA